MIANFQSLFVHLTCECLKELRTRGLYTVIDLERCFNHSSQLGGSASVAKALYKSVCQVLEKSSSLAPSDRLRLVSLYLYHMGVESLDGDQLPKEVEHILKAARIRCGFLAMH